MEERWKKKERGEKLSPAGDWGLFAGKGGFSENVREKEN